MHQLVFSIKHQKLGPDSILPFDLYSGRNALRFVYFSSFQISMLDLTLSMRFIYRSIKNKGNLHDEDIPFYIEWITQLFGVCAHTCQTSFA